ncbi:hypothetical protein [Oryzifoliimicrobium ureilyticus]|uniref:hypothetical protein n=1 Tax=Oryzifoliimicrobium ureilyticus TaxID=3113724 RepID=UPI003076335D
MTAGAPFKVHHTRCYEGFAVRALKALDPYASPCALLIDDRHSSQAKRDYQARMLALKASIHSLTLQAERPELTAAVDRSPKAAAQLADIFARITHMELENEARRHKDMTAGCSPMAAEKARRILVRVGALLAATSKNVPDPYGAAAAILLENMPNVRAKDVTDLKRDIRRDFLRFYAENRKTLLEAHQDRGEKSAAFFFISFALLVQFDFLYRLFQHFRDELARTGTAEAGAEKKLDSWVTGGRLFEIAAEINESPSATAPTVSDAESAAVHLEILALKAEQERAQGKAFPKSKTPNPGLSINAVVFATLGHVGKRLTA